MDGGVITSQTFHVYYRHCEMKGPGNAMSWDGDKSDGEDLKRREARWLPCTVR